MLFQGLATLQGVQAIPYGGVVKWLKMQWKICRCDHEFASTMTLHGFKKIVGTPLKIFSVLDNDEDLDCRDHAVSMKQQNVCACNSGQTVIQGRGNPQ